MRRHWIGIVGVLGILALIAGCAGTRDAQRPAAHDPDEVARHEAHYNEWIAGLLPAMGQADLVERKESQQELEKACHEAGAPGRDAKRAGLCRAMLAHAGPRTPQPARVWLLRKIEPLGAGESVEGLAALLHDDDPRIRELARRALQNNPSPAAGEALAKDLEQTPDPEWRIALLNALAARGELRQAPSTFPYLADPDDRVALAAIAALGDLGHVGDLSRLDTVRASGDAARARAAALGQIRIADREAASGGPVSLTKTYRAILESSAPTSIRVAALHGMVEADEAASLPTLLDVIASDEDPQMRRIAARFAQDLPGEEVTMGLAGALAAASPETRVQLIRTLAYRGDPVAFPTVFETYIDPQEEVRIAVLEALPPLGGDERTVPLLLRAAAMTRGRERDAARESLAILPGKSVDAALTDSFGDYPDCRAEAMRALTARRVTAATPAILEQANDDERLVRLAAFEALADLAVDRDIPDLVSLLVTSPDPETEEGAENALVAVCLRLPEGEGRAAPVLQALEASPLRSAPLYSVLGRIEGEGSLAALRVAVAKEDGENLDAAVRALSGWQDPEVLEDLELIARDSSNEKHRILALRGYVRLVRLPSDRDGVTTHRMIREALLLSERPDETRLALAALGDLTTSDALETALNYLDRDELQAEAAACVLEIAKPLSFTDYERAVETVERVRSAAERDAVRARADEAREFIEEYRGFCTTWQFSGPHRMDGKKGIDLLDVPFAPELSGASEARWEPLSIIHPKTPWRFDLEKTMPASQCCAYARTTIEVNDASDARLLVGSDDGVKVWLNGEVVHLNPSNRGLTCGEDQVDVTLRAGSNELLVKVAQGGGSWGFCVAVRDADGGPLEGLRFRLE